MAKKQTIPEDGPVWRKSAEQATLDQMPKFNPHATGHGPHGPVKYDREKAKRDFQRDLEQDSWYIPST